jgi:hypothetical protein
MNDTADDDAFEHEGKRYPLRELDDEAVRKGFTSSPGGCRGWRFWPT